MTISVNQSSMAETSIINGSRCSCLLNSNACSMTNERATDDGTVQFERQASGRSCNCSSCGKPPNNAYSVCRQGLCGFACSADTIICSGKCIKCRARPNAIASCGRNATCTYACTNAADILQCGNRCLKCQVPEYGRAFCGGADGRSCDVACRAGFSRSKEGQDWVCKQVSPVSHHCTYQSSVHTSHQPYQNNSKLCGMSALQHCIVTSSMKNKVQNRDSGFTGRNSSSPSMKWQWQESLID